MTAPGERGNRLAALAQNLLVVLVALVFALLLAEGVIRAFRLVPVNDYRKISDRAAPWHMRPHASMLDDQPEFRVAIRINGAGYRDREFTTDRVPGRTRIALIGDSFTFGTGVAEGARTSERLEARLRAAGLDCEVYNFGVAGLDTYGAIEVLERGVAPFRPDWVALMLYLGNDVTDNARDIRRPGAAAVAAPSAPPRSSLASRALRGLAARSRLYQFVMIRVASVPALSAIYNRLKAANLAGEVADQLELLNRRNAERSPLWQPTLDALRDFAGRVVERGAHPLVVLLPSRLQYDDPVWDRLAAARHLDPAAYSRSLPNQILGAGLTRERSVPVLDPLEAFQATGAGAAATYFPINGHFTAKGHELLAEAMAQYFRTALSARR